MKKTAGGMDVTFQQAHTFDMSEQDTREKGTHAETDREVKILHTVETTRAWIAWQRNSSTSGTSSHKRMCGETEEHEQREIHRGVNAQL